MKQKYIYTLFLLVLAIFIIPFSCSHLTESAIDDPKNEILLRKIGHEVLISSNDKTSKVVPITCKGRNMPLDCYIITLKFVSKTNILFTKYSFFAILFLVISILFLIRFRKVKSKKEPMNAYDEACIIIGKYCFYFQKNQLQFENEQISLIN